MYSRARALDGHKHTDVLRSPEAKATGWTSSEFRDHVRDVPVRRHDIGDSTTRCHTRLSRKPEAMSHGLGARYTLSYMHLRCVLPGGGCTTRQSCSTGVSWTPAMHVASDAESRDQRVKVSARGENTVEMRNETARRRMRHQVFTRNASGHSVGHKKE